MKYFLIGDYTHYSVFHSVHRGKYMWFMMLKCKIHPQGMASTLENLLTEEHMVVKAWNSQPKYLGINANSATNEGDAAVIRNSILWDVTS